MTNHQYIIQVSPDDATAQLLDAYESGIGWGISATTYGLALLSAVGLISLVVAFYRS